jgi:hypothetical protein
MDSLSRLIRARSGFRLRLWLCLGAASIINSTARLPNSTLTMPVVTVRKWLGIELIEVSITEKLVATLGGGLSILALMGFSFWVLPVSGAAAVIASMGASAVLLFAVPHGPLSQPWPVIGVNGGRKVRRGHWDDKALEKCGTSLVEKEGCTPTWKSGVRFADGC